MHDARAVRHGECRGGFAQHSAGVVHRQPAGTVQVRLETRTRDQRHHVPHQPFSFTHTVDRDDVRMPQSRDRFGFTPKALAHHGLSGELRP